jgi:beta-N-acetylhexosaminidase
VTGVLRQQLGYDGVIITDALWMAGVKDQWGPGPSAVLAVQAGNDILIAAYNSGIAQVVLDALKGAITSGQITMARIDQSVRRILMLKIKYHLLPLPPQLMAEQPLVSP